MPMFIGRQALGEDVRLLYIRIDLLDDNPFVSTDTRSKVMILHGDVLRARGDFGRKCEAERSIVVLKHCRVEDHGFDEGHVEGAARFLQ